MDRSKRAEGGSDSSGGSGGAVTSSTRESGHTMVKFILLGTTGVGKTSLLQRFAEGKFQTNASTIGVDFRWRDVDLAEGQRQRIHVWDTAGQEQFQAISRPYYRQADGALLVYDCCNKTSLFELESFLNDARELCPLGTAFVLVANKTDKRPASSTSIASVPKEFEDVVVTTVEGEKWAKRRGIPLFFETSAKNGDWVDACFVALAKHVASTKLTVAALSNNRSPVRKSLNAPLQGGGGGASEHSGSATRKSDVPIVLPVRPPSASDKKKKKKECGCGK